MRIGNPELKVLEIVARQERRKWPTLSMEDYTDVKHDTVVELLEYTPPKEIDDVDALIQRMFTNNLQNFKRNRDNRRRLEEENAETIVKNTTPTVLNDWAGGPEDFIDAEQLLRARWKKLSPLLRRVARRTFFGYMESPEKVARELGMTVAAVNMARTRIKQHMNGVSK
jgi:DNA-directed RNA polymerase specialized sigma24 family protein